ncbi:MAG: heavy-metal-associated domain-containing protein [Ignavibacteria bacterium]|nr:heavy-metal-associated domain-containing protein [Ignavibacteria bacterium]
MTNKYKVTGMTCSHCVAMVKKTLSGIEGLESVIVTLDPPEAEIKMNHHIEISTLNSILEKAGNYKLEESENSNS